MIPETNIINRWLKELILAWFDNYNHEKEKDFNLHDPLAVFLSYYPEFVTWQEGEVFVEKGSEMRGKTVLRCSNSPRDCVAIDCLDPDEVAKSIFDLIFK
jgi:inosine-uridine nucleoside N-ribohydrolase